MKTDKYYNIGNINPWETFRKGILPIGLANAYRDKHGYDPLKACRICFWLENLIYFTWYWFGMIIVTTVTLIIEPERHLLSELRPLAPCAIIIALIPIFALILTRRIYKQRRRQMLKFHDAICLFVSTFRLILEDKASNINTSTRKEELHLIVSSNMIQMAKVILEKEITDNKASDTRIEFKQKSSIANDFGLGCEWSIYFEEAQKTIRPYELFAWEI